ETGRAPSCTVTKEHIRCWPAPNIFCPLPTLPILAFQLCALSGRGRCDPKCKRLSHSQGRLLPSPEPSWRKLIASSRGNRCWPVSEPSATACLNLEGVPFGQP